MSKLNTRFGSIKLSHQKIRLLYHRTAKNNLRKKKGVFLIVHGLLEHSMNYEHLEEVLASKGFVVYGFDLRGHGRSTGLRGHVDLFTDYVDDLNRVVENICRWEQEKQISLFAHSMGGLISCYYSVRKPQRIKKLMLSSPSVGIEDNWATLLAPSVILMSSILPQLYVSQMLPKGTLTHCEKMLEHIDNDPLRQKKMTLNLMVEFYQAVEGAKDLAAEMRIPTYIFQAGDDQLVSVAKVKAFYANLNTPHKDYIEYPGFFHEILNEVDKEVVIQDILSYV